MTLKEWRDLKGLSLSACAERFGAANSTVVWRWETGAVMPKRIYIQRIFAVTDGAVTPNDFYDLKTPVEAGQSSEAA